MAMGSYFSDREFGPQPRVGEQIEENAWGGIIAAVDKRLHDGSFGHGFPEPCPDGGAVCGCDATAFVRALKGEVPALHWPLRDKEVPPTAVILDLIQFCYGAVGKPIPLGDYHHFYRHNHLRFDPGEGKDLFSAEINRIFARNGLVYELGPDGEVTRIGPPVLREALGEAEFSTGDADLDNLLNAARRKFLDPDPVERRDSLEKLWDAWERVKTIEPGTDKKGSVKALLDKAAAEPQFRAVLEAEAAALTEIGNRFRIRHSEVGRVQIDVGEHVDYFFHRLFALIRLLLRVTGRGT